MGECIFYYMPKNFNEFFSCIYFSEGRVGGGGGLLMHVYVWEHIACVTEPIDGC